VGGLKKHRSILVVGSSSHGSLSLAALAATIGALDAPLVGISVGVPVKARLGALTVVASAAWESGSRHNLAAVVVRNRRSSRKLVGCGGSGRRHGVGGFARVLGVGTVGGGGGG
jgi:hypothetical protein